MTTQDPNQASFQVTVQYFAAMREISQKSKETLNIASCTAASLYAELRARYDFPYPECDLRVAIGDNFSPWTTLLQDGDKISFIPPVSGG